MRFVVGTHSYLLLVTANPNAVTNVRILDTGYFDGADVFSDGTILACYKKEPWSKRSPTGFRFYSEDGFLNIPPIDGSDILDPHQLTLDADQRGCWNCSTATNELVYKSLRNSEKDRRFWFEGAVPGQNWNHINSVCIPDNEIDRVIVMFHNWGRENTQIRYFDWNGETLKDISTLDLVYKSCHNIETWGDNDFAYNASDHGRIVHGIWLEGSEDCPIGNDWHPKGMAVTDQYVVSGYSEHAVSTPRRFVSESGLAFVDRKTWTLAGMPVILLPDGKHAGNVNEVRAYPDTGEDEESASDAEYGLNRGTVVWDEA